MGKLKCEVCGKKEGGTIYSCMTNIRYCGECYLKADLKEKIE